MTAAEANTIIISSSVRQYVHKCVAGTRRFVHKSVVESSLLIHESVIKQGKFIHKSVGAFDNSSIKSLSVGYQEQERMFSLDFEEFLKAKGYSEDHLEDVYGHLVEARPLNEAVANAYARLFLDYCALGGMPEVVAGYIARGTFEETTSIQRRIVSDYRADIQKYGEGLDPVRIVGVFDSIAPQLAKENKKFKFSQVASGARV